MTFLRLFAGFNLQILPFAFLCFYPFSARLKSSKRRVTVLSVCGILFLGLLFTAVCLWLQTFVPAGQQLFIDANCVFMVCLIPCFVWYFCIVEEIWQKKLLVFAFALTGALAMTSVCNILETWFIIDAPYDGLPYSKTTIPLLSAVTAVVLPVLWLLMKYRYIPVSDALVPKENKLLSMLSILLFIVLASGLISIDYMHIYNPMSLFLFGALWLAVFVIYDVCFQMFRLSHAKMQSQQKLSQMRFQMEIQHEQYKRFSDNMENSRKVRHDFRHHMVALEGFLNRGDLEGAKQYISEYVRMIDESAVPNLCKNPVVNAIVSYYQSCAREAGVSFAAHIALPGEIAIKDADLAVLLGNLLENAEEAAVRADSEHRFINLNIICSGQMMAVTIDNGFDGAVRVAQQGYLSIKEQHTGIGLQSIRSIAEKYD